jgi:hypothetical protein
MADQVDDAQQSAAWRASRRSARRFRETGNALYAWEAAGLALAAGVPLPAPVLGYVTKAAQRLGAVPKDRIANPRKHIAQCLGLSGPGPSAFERRRRFERDLLVMRLADALRRTLAITRGDALVRAGEDAGRDADSIVRQARRRTNPP